MFSTDDLERVQVWRHKKNSNKKQNVRWTVKWFRKQKTLLDDVYEANEKMTAYEDDRVDKGDDDVWIKSIVRIFFWTFCWTRPTLGNYIKIVLFVTLFSDTVKTIYFTYTFV